MTLAWTASEGANAYHIYREILVTIGVDEDGKLVELDEPRPHPVLWGRVETEGTGLIEHVIASLDGDATWYSVSAVLILDDGTELESEPVRATPLGGPIATGLQGVSWGWIKERGGP